MEHIFKEFYKDPTHQVFKSLRSGAGPALSDQAAWVFDKIFDRRDRTMPKIQAALKLVDAVWTKEERQAIINNNFPDASEPFRLYKKVCRRVVETVHYLKQPMASTVEPTGRSKDALCGLCNALGTNKEVFQSLDKFVPDWLNDGKIEKPYPLTTLAAQYRAKIVEHVERQERIERAQASNPYRRNNNNNTRRPRSNFNG